MLVVIMLLMVLGMFFHIYFLFTLMLPGHINEYAVPN